MRHTNVTALTATGDTTRTSAGTVTLPSNAKRIVGVGLYANSSAAMTTAESVTGIFEVVIDNLGAIKPAIYPLDIVNCLTSGTVMMKPTVWDTEGWDPVGSSVVEFFVTMDMAQTGALKARGYVVFEV